MLVAARQLATAKVLEVEVGDCDLGECFATVAAGPGLIILEGLMAIDTRVGTRTATELVGAGDLLQPARAQLDDLLERADAWHALAPTRLALLDAEFAERMRPWPQITHALLRRAGERTANVDALRAITCHPRLELRLALLFWHLASRWGRVEPAAFTCHCRSPTACSVNSSVPSAHRSRTLSAGSRVAASWSAPPATGT
jgi:hypothetical protein